MSQKEKLQASLNKINDMLQMSKSDNSIDVKDLRIEKAYCERELRKIRREERNNDL